MKLTVLLLAFLVSAALALPQYKRKGRGPRPDDSAKPDNQDVSAKGPKGGNGDLPEGIEACMERAKTCGADKGPEPTTASKRLLREIQEVVDKENEDKCETAIDDAAKKRSLSAEEEEAIEKVKESCICKEDKETEAERLLRRLLESGSEDKNDDTSDEKERKCRKALEEADMIDSDNEDDQSPSSSDDDEYSSNTDDEEALTPADDDESDNQGPPPSERELIHLIRKLAHIKK